MYSLHTLEKRCLDFQTSLECTPERADLEPDHPQEIPERTCLTPAAVLICVRPHTGNEQQAATNTEGSVVFVKRSIHLRKHAGQIGFPGGKYETEDTSLHITALRETREETGLEASQVTLLTRLPHFKSGTGFCIWPYIGLISSDSIMKPDKREIDEVFELPLSFVMNRRNFSRKNIQLASGTRTYYETFYQDYHIWGITASILVNMSKRIFTNALRA